MFVSSAITSLTECDQPYDTMDIFCNWWFRRTHPFWLEIPNPLATVTYKQQNMTAQCIVDSFAFATQIAEVRLSLPCRWAPSFQTNRLVTMTVSFRVVYGAFWTVLGKEENCCTVTLWSYWTCFLVGVRLLRIVSTAGEWIKRGQKKFCSFPESVISKSGRAIFGQSVSERVFLWYGENKKPVVRRNFGENKAYPRGIVVSRNYISLRGFVVFFPFHHHHLRQ